MKKILIAFIFFTLIIAGHSFAFSLSAPTETISVPALTTKEIKIRISSDTTENIAVNLIEPRTWVTLGATQLTIPAGGSRDVSVFISPQADTVQGLHKISVLFESLQTKELKKADLFILVEKGELVLLEKIMVTGSLQPLGSAKIEIYVKNNKPVTVQGAELFANISSPARVIGTIRETIPRLDPGESTIVDTTVFFEKFASAGTYTVDAETRFQDEKVRLVQTFSVELKPVITRDTEKFSFVFGYGKRIHVANNGNMPGDATVTEILSDFDSAFFSGEPSTVENNVYTWVVEDMQPGQAQTIEYRVNYAPLSMLIFALLAVGWLYFFRFRTIRVRKHVIQKKRIAEGDEFTVTVEIINSLGKKVDAEVHDFVPAVFDFKDTEGIKPKRQKGQVGTSLVWHARGLNPHEARIFTYKIVPVFGIHGSINLPKASAVFQYGRRKIESRSMSPSLGLEPETRAEEYLWQKFFRRKK